MSIFRYLTNSHTKMTCIVKTIILLKIDRIFILPLKQGFYSSCGQKRILKTNALTRDAKYLAFSQLLFPNLSHRNLGVSRQWSTSHCKVFGYRPRKHSCVLVIVVRDAIHSWNNFSVTCSLLRFLLPKTEPENRNATKILKRGCTLNTLPEALVSLTGSKLLAHQDQLDALVNKCIKTDFADKVSMTTNRP